MSTPNPPTSYVVTNNGGTQQYLVNTTLSVATTGSIHVVPVKATPRKVRRTLRVPEGVIFIAHCVDTGARYECSDPIKLLQIIADNLGDGGEWRIQRGTWDDDGRIKPFDKAERPKSMLIRP